MSRYLRNISLGVVAMVAVALVATSPAIALDPALWDGLVANWAFDETTGTTAYDSVGTANAEWMNVDELDAPESWITGKLGGALYFDQTDSGTGYFAGALIGDVSSLHLGTNACTISSWVKLDMLPSAMGDFGGVFDAQIDGFVMYAGNSEARAKISTADSGNAFVSSTRPGAGEVHLDTDWHHWVASFDGEYSRFYLDGQLMDQIAIPNPSGVQIQTGQVAGIGYQPQDLAASSTSYDRSFLPGAVDDMAIWNRALNVNEINHLYNSGTGTAVLASNPTIAPPTPAMPTPVVHYEFEGNTSNSGSGGTTYDGTVVDGSLGNTSYVQGKIGQGFYLDNPQDTMTDGDYVSTPYVMTDQGTISFFVKPGEFFDWLGLFDNKGSLISGAPQEDWECWIYADGRCRFRVESNAYITKDLDDTGGANQWHHIAVSWFRGVGQDTVNVCMYVNGELVGGDDGGTWIDPGTEFYIGGGNDLNEYGNGIFDDFRIYDVALESWQVEELYNLGNPLIPGDTNHDNIVDADDAEVLSNNWGSSVSGGGVDGDFNGDGVVNAKDASILAANWGDHNESNAPTSVPEPTTLILLLSAALFVLPRRRK